MSRTCIFFRKPPPADRWFEGDHRWRAKVRRVIRGRDPIGGIQRVYLNLVKGLQRLGVPFLTNIDYADIREGDRVGVIGAGPQCLDGYAKRNRVLAGVAVVEHPLQWPTLFEDRPVSQYVVHCDWVRAMYERHYGARVCTWAVGIDTEAWKPGRAERHNDVLIYDKVRWDGDRVRRALLAPLLETLQRSGLTYEMIRYGSYKEEDYRAALHRSKSMLFLCEHETQGLAYQEAMACNVPILAWDPGQWLDTWRFRYGETFVPATSVPFFDARCGLRFKTAVDFPETLGRFVEMARGGHFQPRDYVLENLTLEKCAKDYLRLLAKFSP